MYFIPCNLEYILGKNMFLVPVVSVDFVNGPCSKLDHCLVFVLSKRLFFVPNFEQRYKRACVQTTFYISTRSVDTCADI